MPYSASQIVSLACQIAKVQSGMASQVGQLLNMTLANYAQTVDLDTVRLTTTFNISAAATGIGITGAGYLLPTNYNRAVQVFYNVNGTIFNLDPLTIEKYYTLFQGTGIADYPEWFSTDISQQAKAANNGAPVIFFWPPPAIPLTINLLYRPQTSDITSPETSNVVPWFENQLTLLKDLSAQAMMISDDARKPGFDKEVEQRMRKYLIMKDDNEDTPIRVKLDPELFRPVNNLKPTKITSIF